METTISIEPSTNRRPENSISPKTREWKSCCFSINSSAAKYFVQVGILTSLIIYSSTMLVVNQTCESQRNYGSLLLVCLGCFLPTPKRS